MLPGGVANPDNLRMDADAVRFIGEFFEQAKPVAAICHAPWTLVEADVVKGRKVTSWPSLKTDIRNAGGNWVDEEVVVDEGLVTSRKPDDLPAFCAKLVEEFCEGEHEGQARSASGTHLVIAILDVDGTLVDTNYHHAIAWFRALKRHGRCVAAVAAAPAHGDGRRPAGRRRHRRRVRGAGRRCRPRRREGGVREADRRGRARSRAPRS